MVKHKLMRHTPNESVLLGCTRPNGTVPINKSQHQPTPPHQKPGTRQEGQGSTAPGKNPGWPYIEPQYSRDLHPKLERFGAAAPIYKFPIEGRIGRQPPRPDRISKQIVSNALLEPK
jgi:hypothetical protein